MAKRKSTFYGNLKRMNRERILLLNQEDTDLMDQESTQKYQGTNGNNRNGNRRRA